MSNLFRKYRRRWGEKGRIRRPDKMRVKIPASPHSPSLMEMLIRDYAPGPRRTYSRAARRAAAAKGFRG